MGSFVLTYIKESKDLIFSEWVQEMRYSQPESNLVSIPQNTLEMTNETFFELIFNYLTDQYTKGKLSGFIERILKFGWPLSYITTGLQLFRKTIVSKTNLLDSNDVGIVKEIYREMDEIINPIFNQLIQDATVTWERTISAQKRALLELSAPLIPIMDKICVMPLIGTIDTDRAKLIMENLLQGVINNQAEVVLIDITGVPIVDTMVAHHIIQASEAVRLVGSRCILVGIRPEIAQTIVDLGIDLGEFPTKSTLQKGMESALELIKRKIVEID